MVRRLSRTVLGVMGVLVGGGAAVGGARPATAMTVIQATTDPTPE
jgi:hypothetical protein